MASSTRKQCGKGNDCKQAGVATCEGCSQVFCTRHFTDHRRSLGAEMNVILDEYNDFNNTIIEQPTNPNIETLIQEINEWEQESIRKIQQKATALRLELSRLHPSHMEGPLTELQSLAEQIKNSQEQDDFIETDLRRWKEKLDDLRLSLTSPSTIVINQHENVPLVHDISTSFVSTDKKELFDRVFSDGVQKEEDGAVVTSVKLFMTYTEIRGKNSYTFGYHKVRLQVEASSNGWMFLGINSKSTPLQQRSYVAVSAYGWCNTNYVYSNGSYQRNETKPSIQMNKNDIITLVFDCDNRKISMIHERTNIKYDLPVDIKNCPFPWQLHVNLCQLGSRVRILST